MIRCMFPGQGFEDGLTQADIREYTQMDPWFIEQLWELHQVGEGSRGPCNQSYIYCLNVVTIARSGYQQWLDLTAAQAETWLKTQQLTDISADDMHHTKQRGFSDVQIARFTCGSCWNVSVHPVTAAVQVYAAAGQGYALHAADCQLNMRMLSSTTCVAQRTSDVSNILTTASTPLEVRARRKELGVIPSMKRVDTCAAEFEAATPYMYSSYDGNCECEPTSERKVSRCNPARIWLLYVKFVNPKAALSSITVMMVLHSGTSSCK